MITFVLLVIFQNGNESDIRRGVVVDPRTETNIAAGVKIAEVAAERNEAAAEIERAETAAAHPETTRSTGQRSGVRV